MIWEKQIEIIEKKSRFISYFLRCESVIEVEEALGELRTEHKKASHICYAYRFSVFFLEKAIDDGEPSGTAGRPILNVLQKKNLQNVCVFVVRYFGGVKLGSGGLVRAYTKATSSLIKEVK